MTDRQQALDTVAQRHRGLRVVVTALHQAVEDARRAGASWAEIAEVMGMSADEAREAFGETP